MHDSIGHRRSPLQRPTLYGSRWIARAFAVAALGSVYLFAQNQPTAPAPAHPQKPSPSGQITQPAPPAPDWPINAEPKPASIGWNRDELRIDAANSSLRQILTDVASATGATVDGIGKDERIFGSFGPAPARDVLVQLLQGSGYNVVMVGDQGQGVPRQVLLSARNANKGPQGASHPTPEENEDDVAPEVQYDPPPQPTPQQLPQPIRPGFNPNAPGMPGNPQQPGQQPGQPGQPPNNPPTNPPNE